MKILEGRRRFGLLCAMGTAILCLDQWTKYLIVSRFYWGESLPIIRGYFDITYVRNSGAAFGLLHRAPAWFRDPFFLAVPIVALVVILVIFSRLKSGQHWTAVALSLVFGGAVGNLIDRLRFRWVIDFLYFHWKEVFYWPAFNVADSCIVVGVAILFLQSFIGDQRAPKSSSNK